MVVLRQQERLPVLPVLRHVARAQRLSQDHARAKARPVIACQNITLGALDINLEKIDGRYIVVIAEPGQRQHWHAQHAVVRAKRACAVRVAGDGGRKAVQPLHVVECGVPARAAKDDRRNAVAGPHMLVKRCQILLRFNNKAAPALQIEPAGDIVCHRMAGTDIDVEARRLAGESLRKVIVLKVLGIGHVHRGAFHVRPPPAAAVRQPQPMDRFESSSFMMNRS